MATMCIFRDVKLRLLVLVPVTLKPADDVSCQNDRAMTPVSAGCLTEQFKQYPGYKRSETSHFVTFAGCYA